MGDCTFVNAYCCSGERFAFRKRSTSYWKRMGSEEVVEYQSGESQPCRATDEFQQIRMKIDCLDRHR